MAFRSGTPGLPPQGEGAPGDLAVGLLVGGSEAEPWTGSFCLCVRPACRYCRKEPAAVWVNMHLRWHVC